MESAAWNNADDIRRDLFEYSNIDYTTGTFEDAPPKSVAEYRARTSKVNKPGLFDDNEGNVEVFISGRGKYQMDRIIRPGQQVDFIPEDDYLIQKKIREVSGLGYRNEIIERQFKQNSDAEEEISQVDIVPNLKLHPAINGLSGSSSSSPSHSPMRPMKKEKQLPELESSNTNSEQEQSPETKTLEKKKKKKTFSKWPSESSSSTNTSNWRAKGPSGVGSYYPDNWRTNNCDRVGGGNVLADFFPPLK